MNTDEYTTTNIPAVTINGKPYAARIITHPTYSDSVILTGARGAEYFLRQYGNAGLYEVVSFKSGASLRDKYSKAVRVAWIGDVIEDVTRTPAPVH